MFDAQSAFVVPDVEGEGLPVELESLELEGRLGPLPWL